LENRPFLNQRRVSETKALAGFEKSGHFFFNAPVGAAMTTVADGHSRVGDAEPQP